VTIVGGDGEVTVGGMAAAVAVARAGRRRVARGPGARGRRRRRGSRRPHPPPWLAATTGVRRSPAGGGGAKYRAACGPAAGSHWEGGAGGGRHPAALTRGGSGASGRGGGVSSGIGARATARATCRRRWRAPAPPRPPVGGHRPATPRLGVPPPKPPQTQRAACSRVELGGHGRTTGRCGVGHAQRTCGNVCARRWRRARHPVAQRALREKPGGKPASPNRNRHTRLTISVLWHRLGIDCRPPLTTAHRRLLLPTSHFIG